MVDGMTGQAVTRANFQGSLASCGFGVGSNAAILRDVVASTLPDFGNWAAFIDGLGNAFLQAQAGVRDCPCDDNCSTYNTADAAWEVTVGVANSDQTITGTGLGNATLVYHSPSVVDVTSLVWQDKDTGSNDQKITVQGYLANVLIYSAVLYDDFNTTFDWTDEPTRPLDAFPPMAGVDEVRLINEFTSNTGVFKIRNITVCWE
jgi:hypothetical protein